MAAPYSNLLALTILTFACFIVVHGNVVDRTEHATDLIYNSDTKSGGKNDQFIEQIARRELETDVDARCVLCKFFMKKIVAALESAKAAGVIDAVVDKACRNIINTSLCDTVASTVTRYIENLINDDLQPDKACLAAKFCPALFDLDLDLDVDDVIITRELRSGLGCKICTYFVDKIDHAVDSYEPKVESWVYQYCDRLPAPTNKECEQTVDRVINNLIQEFISVDAICRRALHACT